MLHKDISIEEKYDKIAMQLLASALCKLSLSYKFAIAPVPNGDGLLRVVFSRPTFQFPDSQLFVTLDLHPHVENDQITTFIGEVQEAHWPIKLVVDNGNLICFPEEYITKAWTAKLCVNQKKLWVELEADDDQTFNKFL